MRASLDSTQRRARIEFFRLLFASLPATTPAQSTTGVPEGAYRCTAAKTATGVAVLTFNEPFQRVPAVTVSAMSAAGKLFAVVAAVSVSGITVNVFADDGTATDPTQLHIHVIGADTADQIA